MVNENTVLIDSKGKIVVLDPIGLYIDGFRPDSHPDNLFKSEDSIFLSSSSYLTSYGLDGTKQWEVSECHSGTKAPITYNNGAFLVVNSQLREELDYDDLTKTNILGHDFFNTETSQTDLWMASVDLEGKVEWYKYLQDKSLDLGYVHAKDDQVILPYSTLNDGQEIEAIMILDSLGNKVNQYNLEALNGPTAVKDNCFMFMERSEYDSKIKCFDISSGRMTYSIPFEHYTCGCSGNQNNSCLIGNKMFVRSNERIHSLDTMSKALISHDIPNYDIHELDGMLIVETAPKEFLHTSMFNRVGLGQIIAYDSNLNPQWKFNPPEEFKDSLYSIIGKVNNGFILSGKDLVMKIDSKGEIIWEYHHDGFFRGSARPI